MLIFEHDIRGHYLAFQQTLFQPKREPFAFLGQVILRLKQQASAFTFRIFNDSEGGSGCGYERDRSGKSVECTLVTAATLVEVSYSDHRYLQPVTHFGEGLQHLSRFNVSVPIGATHVRTDRIDDDETNIADVSNLGFEKVYIGLQTESFPPGPVCLRGGLNNMDS